MKRYLTYKLGKKFNNIKTVEMQIAKRRLTFLGKIIRMNNDKIPAQLLSAVCQSKSYVERHREDYSRSR